jgi:hypothetical protein
VLELKTLEQSYNLMIIGLSPKKFKFSQFSNAAIVSLYSICVDFISLKEIEICIEDSFHYYKSKYA